MARPNLIYVELQRVPDGIAKRPKAVSVVEAETTVRGAESSQALVDNYEDASSEQALWEWPV